MKKSLSETFLKDCEMYFSREMNIPPAKPAMVILDITHRCNLNCAMCDISKDGFDPKKEFTSKEVFKVIDDMTDWGVKELVLSGGEALLRSDLFEILNYARGKVNTGILTNGILIDDSVFKKIEPYLSEGSLSLTISLDGINAKTHDFIRGKAGAFEKTTALLKKLSDLKKKNPRVNFNVISIILNANLEELERIFKFVKSLSANTMQFQPLLPNNLRLEKRYLTSFWVPESRYAVLDRVMDRIIAGKRQYPDFLVNSERDLHLVKKYFRRELRPDEVKCYAIFKTMLISMDGKATACNTSYGNVRKQNLKEMWKSPEAANSRRIIKNCANPCLLPCFTDSRLYSLKGITAEFIRSSKKFSLAERKNEMMKAMKTLDSYRAELENKHAL